MAFSVDVKQIDDI